ncbi:ABC transporter ATP-binding protein [Roseiarcaceae bacterium H3SJ34-1]|uniref:ABC transporter ATP-binding protein n=1 Tax=Terripilifer ovatus TaxID=3032367 RepID=UPI003AB9618F|nr:ABC transporter ATP-binding protein [Roseiarcaceae bacterium H3SJ34-1]
MNVLDIQNLHVAFTQRGRVTPVLRGIDLSIEPGRICGLVGESGGGKTMVGKAITGILPEDARVTAGRILFKGQNLVDLADKERRQLLGRSIAMILQQPTTALNPVLRIETQIVEVLQRQMGLAHQAARARALDLLNTVQIRAPERVLRQYPHELSGGMCQRVVIAIAFSCQPALIVADEPTTALDVTVQFEILRLLKILQRDFGTAVLFITHDLGVVANLCDRVSVIFGGRIIEEGQTADIFTAPKHPYTSALMAASPRHDQPEKGLHPVPAQIVGQLWREIEDYDRARSS